MFMTLVLMGMVAMMHTTVTVHSLQRSEAERSIASQGLVSVLEEVRQLSRSLVGAEPSWGEALTAAVAAGGELGFEFPIDGLDPVEGENAVCSLQIVTSETVTDNDLGFSLGMPLDLNNNGVVGDADVTDSAQMIPVLVRARWGGPLGTRQLVQGVILLGF